MLESLLCNSCGAPLEVPDSANFAKCNHCNTTLRVHRSSGVTTTEAIEKLTETTENLAEQVQKLTRQNDLEKLDRQWEADRLAYMYRDQQGGSHLPAQRFAWLIGGSVALFGGIWTALAITITKSAPNVGPFALAKVAFPLFGVCFIAFGIFAAVRLNQKAKMFQEAQASYRRERDRIIEGDE